MKGHRSHKRGWGFWLLILTVPVLVLASSLPGKNLTLLQEIDPSNHELLDIESSKDLAIIAGGLGGTAIYDISNPKNPEELGQMTLPGCEHGRVYKIINVNDPENPKLLGEASIDGHAKNLAYHENKLYVTNGDLGINVFDVSDPTHPTLHAKQSTRGVAQSISVTSDRVYVATWSNVEVYELRNCQLLRTGYKNTGGRVMDVEAVGKDILLQAEWTTLRVMEYGIIPGPDIDLSPRTLRLPQFAIEDEDTLSIAVKNTGHSPLQFTSIATNRQEFKVITEITSLAPGEGDTLNILSTGLLKNESGTLNLVTNDPDEGIVNVAIVGNGSIGVGQSAPDFDHPVVMNSDQERISLSELQGRIVVLAFFASWCPACAPEFADLEHTIWQRYRDDEVVVLGLSKQSEGHIQQFIQNQGVSFPILWDNGTSYWSYNIPGAISPYPRDFVIDREGIIQYANTEYDPEAMRLVIESLLQNDTGEPGVSKPRISADTAGVDVSLEQNQPNPFNNTTKISYQIERCMRVNLAVYNVYGKRVAKLISGEQAAGNYTVSWNGLNHAGQTVSSGMYYYQLQTEERNISKKLLFLK